MRIAPTTTMTAPTAAARTARGKPAWRVAGRAAGLTAGSRLAWDTAAAAVTGRVVLARVVPARVVAAADVCAEAGSGGADRNPITRGGIGISAVLVPTG